MAVSIKDVARMTGLSPSTVSRVINKKGNISGATTERVMEAVQELGYVPNNVARSLKSRKTRTVGVIIPDISETFFSHIIKGVDAVLGEHGYSIVLCDTNENPDKEEKLINVLHESQVDGVVIATVQEGARLEKIRSLQHLPVVFIDNIPRMSANFDSVALDNVRASTLAVDYLLDNGHERIAAIMGKQSEYTGFERYVGFMRALQNRGVAPDPDLIRFGDFKEASGYQEMMALLESGRAFSAVYIASSKMTYGAIAALREKAVRFPEDLSMVGFDVHDEYHLMSPQITTILQPEREIGVAAAQLLLKRMDTEGQQVSFRQRIVLDPLISVKESCRKL